MKPTNLLSIAIVLFLVVISTACHRKITCIEPAQPIIPECIQEKIDNQDENSTVETVIRYTYNNEFVYLFAQGSAYSYNVAYDEDCNLYCTSGIMICGFGEDHCPNFREEAEEETLIWEKEIMIN